MEGEVLQGGLCGFEVDGDMNRGEGGGHDGGDASEGTVPYGDAAVSQRPPICRKLSG